MSDLTVYAESLIATVARAFYTDEAISLVDVLIRDKFLRDDDMMLRLKIDAKKLRQTLQFLHEEHLVRWEDVDDLKQGGSQQTKCYYIDYNRAVHSIRLRVHLLKQQLEQAEIRARSSSFYLCPGYKIKRCNGQYTEEEAQNVLDLESGMFLCYECSRNFENDPNAPPKEAYTLQLVDNAKDLKEAVDNLRRVNVQLSSKFIGNDQMRAGIMDLLQKVRGKGKDPITSNLPTENFALGIGSKRLAGTGRTAATKARKLAQQGVAMSAAQAKNYLVGGSRQLGDDDLIFLKNAMGDEIKFTVERGGGERAQLLATKKRKLRKVMDAAASRVGASLPLHIRVEEERKRKMAKLEEEMLHKKRAAVTNHGTLEFLYDNIGRLNEERKHEQVNQDIEEPLPNKSEVNQEIGPEPDLVVCDDLEELRKLSDERRLAAFQAFYGMEVDRQLRHLRARCEEEDEPPSWEDC